MTNANLIVKKQVGRMISSRVSDSVEIRKESFTEEALSAVRRIMDLFGRVKSTDQAEMIATVLYSYDQLKQCKTTISDKDVNDYVLDWKAEKEFDLCDTIQNMAVFIYGY